MIKKQFSKTGVGLASAIGAYTLWGFLPIYWKFMNSVPATEILAHRIIWAFVFLLCMLLISGKFGAFIEELGLILAQPKKLLGLCVAAVLIAINSLVYIWAVNNDRIIETSLGYYITPLVNVLCGIVIMKETLSRWQLISVIVAAFGVLNLTLHYGQMPWVALSLAFSFGLYGLCKKLLNISATTSIILENIMLAPLAIIYLVYMQSTGVDTLHFEHPAMLGLLIGSGVAIAIPMVLFTMGTIFLPLTIIGFIQFLSPSIALMIGVFLYHETFSGTHVVSFSCIWAALIIFSLERINNQVPLKTLFTGTINRLSSRSKV